MNQLKCDLKFVLWALVAVVLLAPVQVWLELREFEQFERGPDLGLVALGVALGSDDDGFGGRCGSGNSEGYPGGSERVLVVSAGGAGCDV